jgi:queuine/archaeosine tRNA-ribosyltransferase
MLGPQIASIHNLGFYLWLVREARKHIIVGDIFGLERKHGRQAFQKVVNLATQRLLSFNLQKGNAICA